MTPREARRQLATLILSCLALGALAGWSMARAEEYLPPERVTVHHDPSPGAAWFARVVVENRIGMYNRATVHDTAHGPVTVEYWTTLPSAVGDPGSADRACVVAMPDGVVAVPECVEIMETERGEMFLLKYLGG